MESPLAQNIRKSIENFKNHFKNIHISDFGTIKYDTNHLNSESIDFLFQNNIIPLIFGVNQDDSFKFAKTNGLKIHFLSNELPCFDSANVSKSYLGFQRHRCNLKNIHQIEEAACNSLSLGKMRTFPNLTEPSVRDAQILHLNLNIVRSADVPNLIDALPTGLTAEELCQLMKYVGTSDGIKAIFIDTSVNHHFCQPEANVVAEAIWYFLEGLNMHTKDHPSINKDFSEFIIYSNEYDHDLVFLMNNQTRRWWLKLGDNEKLLACSYEEYQQAIGDELPERILKFIHSNE